MKTDLPSRSGPSATREVIVLLTAAIILAVFAAARYRGLWGEVDTAVFSRAIRAMLAEGRLVPAGYAYSHGYGFPALATSLAYLSGLSVAQLQVFWSMMLMIWILLPAWLAYRELTGSARAATLATSIVLIQPEFLFALLRGSHEKFTRGLMFLCVYLLVRGLLVRREWRRFAAFLFAFYLTIYAIITFNDLMATSFIVGLALALVLSLIANRLAGPATDDTTAMRRRLFYAIGLSLVLAFLFTFYAYPPAREAIRVAKSIVDQVGLLFLNVEEAAVNPYGRIGSAWISRPVYLLVSIANWLLLITSFVLWVMQTVSWWRRHAWPEEPRAILLWSLYGAFGFQGAISILIDFSGALSANLQHRIFPSFAMIAAPYVADWLVRRQVQLSSSDHQVRRALVYGSLAVLVAILGVVAVVKATNEPALSNKWTFHTLAEFSALDWARSYAPNQVTWTAFDERLQAAIEICCDWEAEGARFEGFQPDASTRSYLISDVIRARGERLDISLPVTGDSLHIYSNGSAEILRLRPRTPFQK